MNVSAVMTAGQWEQSVSTSFVPLRVERMSSDFGGTIQQRRFAENSNLSVVSCDASVLARTPQLAQSDHEPAILFVNHLDGPARVNQFGRTAVQRAGQSVLYMTHRPYSLAFQGPIKERVYRVPAASVGIPLRRLENLSALSFDPAAGPFQVLWSYLHGLADAETTLETGVFGRIATELLEVALGSTLSVSPRLSPEAMLVSIKQLIRQRIGDPGLDVDAVAAAFHVSLRQLYVLFNASEQSPAGYIRSTRVDRAKQILLSAPDLPASAVAFQCGFNDLSTFRRAFKTATGVTPADWRRSAYRSGGGSPEAVTALSCGADPVASMP